MIINIIKKFRGKLILATIFSASSSAISIFLLAQISNNITISNTAQMPEKIMVFLLLILLLFSMSFFSQLLLARLGTSFVYQLRTLLLKQTSKVSYQSLEDMGGHRVLAILTTDVTNISVALTILPVFAVNLATVLFCFIYLFMQSATLFLFLFVGLLIGIGISFTIMRIGRRRFIELREKEDNLFSVFKTLVDGSKELNINKHRRDYFYQHQAQPCIEEVRKIEIKAKSYWVLSDSMFRSLIFLILGIVLFVAHVYFKSEAVVLTSFVLFTTYIIGPISFIQSTFQAFIRGKISYNKITALNLTSSDQLLINDNTDRTNQWGELVFTDVSYQYKNNGSYKFAIGPLNLKITQGENIFICGGNGSGKSTFAKVLVGLYHAQGGKITFANQQINPENLQWYRNHFSTIFSDFYLFDHILDSNGELVVNDEVIKHLEKLELADKVEVIDGKISSTKLSQGQRKRLAMLLAYMEDASIYLFDEWAADQDPTFREYFYKELLPEFKAKGKTLIVITHDDKYFNLADKLIKFDNGQLVEQKNKQYHDEITV
ncbi:MAG: cyclic peptide export ABC transporter [Alcanivoracaceae bacterium]|nr:cyclic peptide export ABC transporter [Alcanivoracaceae bacterium]